MPTGILQVDNKKRKTMKRLQNGSIDRSQWPTLHEIDHYLDCGKPTSFQSRVALALKDLIEVADVIDRQKSESDLAQRCAVLEKALTFYADPGRYSRWGARDNPEQDHVVFEPCSWGTVKYHCKPPKEAEKCPWIVAEKALKGENSYAE